MSNLTTRESEILGLSWECFKSDPVVNYTKLAELATLKNAASATTAFLSAKKKMLAKGTANLTNREREILALSWKCFNTAPSVDYKQLAAKAELKNAASATTAFLAAKKKFLAASHSNDETKSKPVPAKKPKKTLPSARNKDVAADEEASKLTSPPPKKRKRAHTVTEQSPKSAAILAAVEGDGGSEEESKPKPKPKRAKKGTAKKARSELEGGEDEGQGVVKSELKREGHGVGESDDGDVDARLLATAQEFLTGEDAAE